MILSLVDYSSKMESNPVPIFISYFFLKKSKERSNSLVNTRKRAFYICIVLNNDFY
ncbi:hypothetical protein Hdeb2414_s1325g01011591 [Helianthus debilis subsp. tardiflorus]